MQHSMQHFFPPIFFHFFATTRLLQWDACSRRLYATPCGRRTKWPMGRCTPLYSIVTVLEWQSRDFFKCLPPLFKVALRQQFILPVSEKVSTDQTDQPSGLWISIPEDSSPLIKYPNKQKIYLLFSRCPVFRQKTGNHHLSTWRRPWVHWPSNCIGIMHRTRAGISQNWAVVDITMVWYSIESFPILWFKVEIHLELGEEEAQFMVKHFMTR